MTTRSPVQILTTPTQKRKLRVAAANADLSLTAYVIRALGLDEPSETASGPSKPQEATQAAKAPPGPSSAEQRTIPLFMGVENATLDALLSEVGLDDVSSVKGG